MKKTLVLLFLILGLAWVGFEIYQQFQEQHDTSVKCDRGRQIVPVTVEPLLRGPIAEIREFSATLKASQEFVVASKISGQIEKISADLADQITPWSNYRRTR